MAPPVSCSVERLQRFGWEAAKKMKRKEKMAHSASLTCEYLGVSTGEGQFDALSSALSSRTVGFEWRVRAGAHGHTQVVTVRCDHLGSRGVPFPKAWSPALQLMDLDEIVDKTVERVISQSKTPGVCCQLLGLPQRAEISEAERTQGALLSIKGIEHVLCAQVLGDQWLVHRGSFEGDSLCEQKPLRPEDLILLDISAAHTDPPLRKRVQSHLHVGQLREYVNNFPCDFNILIAIVIYQAEGSSCAHAGP